MRMGPNELWERPRLYVISCDVKHGHAQLPCRIHCSLRTFDGHHTHSLTIHQTSWVPASPPPSPNSLAAVAIHSPPKIPTSLIPLGPQHPWICTHYLLCYPPHNMPTPLTTSNPHGHLPTLLPLPAVVRHSPPTDPKVPHPLCPPKPLTCYPLLPTCLTSCTRSYLHLPSWPPAYPSPSLS